MCQVAAELLVRHLARRHVERARQLDVALLLVRTAARLPPRRPHRDLAALDEPQLVAFGAARHARRLLLARLLGALQREADRLREPRARRDGHARGLVALAAELDLVRDRDELQRLVGLAARLAVDEQLGVRRPHRDLHLAELRHEPQRRLAPLARAEREAQLGGRVAGQAGTHHHRLAGADAQLERRTAAVGAVEAHARTGRIARHHDDPGTRRGRRAGRRCRQRRERNDDRLQRASARDGHALAVILIAGRAHGQLPLARVYLEGRERRRAARRPVDRHLGPRQARRLDRQPPGQRLERVAQHGPALDHDGLLEAAVARLLRDERVASGDREHPWAERRDRPRPAQRHAVGSGLDHDLDEREPRQQQDYPRGERQRCRHRDQPFEGASRRRRGSTERARDVRDRAQDDVVVVVRRHAAPRRGHQHDRRLRRVRLAVERDAQLERVPPHADLDGGARQTQHVAVAQPMRGGEPRPVAADVRARRRLHEDLAALEAQPRERAGRSGDGHRRARPSERHRKIAGTEAALAAVVPDQQARHSASSQRSETTGPGAPGATLNCRRTSR